ncbi:MAG: BamA/TamA family outer membrane protein [Gemmatimonadota bacterium]
MSPVALLLTILVQVQDTSSYLDADARVLVERARHSRAALDSEIRAYTGTVKQRVGVALRTPLKDRTLYRMESAFRIHWSRDDETVLKVLGARQYHPGSEYRDEFDADLDFGIDEFFDPTMDRLYFGMTDADDDDVWIEHPLVLGAERRYRYQTGDTITMTFPDGRKISVVELRVLPRRDQPKLITGSIWIEPVTGSIVKAAYRLASAINMQRDTDAFDNDDDLKHVPALFKPFEIEVTMISVEYSYWRMKHWLPRAMRMEGAAKAGILTAPAVLEIAYDIDDVLADGDSSANFPSSRTVMRAWRAEGDNIVSPDRRNGHRFYVIKPVDPDSLRNSKDLPPPVWENSTDFITEKDLREMYGGLASLPLPAMAIADVTLQWGPQHPDLLRYNRVEALSVGVRAELKRSVGTYWATARLGVADFAPNLELAARRETMRRTTTLTVGHGLTAVDSRSLALGSSLSALLLGRDDGDYYRTTGARVSVAPPLTQPEWYRFSLFAERHRSAARETNFSIGNVLGGGDFRPNLNANDADLAGAELALRKWWGSDPRGWQLGLEWVTEAADGDFRYARSAATARTAFPILKPIRGAIEVGAGSSEGNLPTQKQFFLGGAHTLRGYPGSAAVGTSFSRARAELAYSLPGGGVAVFSDAGWAGVRNYFDTDAALVSAGIGLTILDGLIRVDLARALRRPTGWRLELHFDSVL